MTSAPVDPLIGHTLDERYVIRSRIARGGMAMVYQGVDLRLERPVAVKIMHQHLVDEENFTRKFAQEARTAAALSHPNIVNVYDQGVDRGVPYLVMELLPGITLRQLLTQDRQLSVDQALEIGDAVLAGLSAAHLADLVHRDVKPENVLLADDGRIKIGDFGLARAVSANTTTGQALLGTIAYLSPELVTRGIADERSDLYAFGIMLYEMLTGTQPYVGEQAMQIAYQHAHSDVPSPSALAPEVPTELDALVRWLTQREPHDRPDTATTALAALRAIRGGDTQAATMILPRFSEAADPPTSFATPSTAVLRHDESLALTTAPPTTPKTSRQAPPSPVTHTAVDRARHLSRRRAQRGILWASAGLLAAALAGGAGWYWGQGPGSLVEVPTLTGTTPEEAALLLSTYELTANTRECSSLSVPEGAISESQPAAGTQLARGSNVELCVSTGPEMLTVPTLVGLTEEAAETAIVDAGFTMGSILDRRFDGGPENTVIAALGSDGAGIGATYPEASPIDVILSAGSIPTVTDTSVDTATSTLKAVGLTVDKALNTDAYHETIEAGRVIDVLVYTDPVRAGESVGLQISKGPQLFAVPDVSGMNVNEAATALRAAGFTVSTGLVPEGAPGALFEVKSTSPAAGEMKRSGTEISLRYI